MICARSLKKCLIVSISIVKLTLFTKILLLVVVIEKVKLNEIQ